MSKNDDLRKALEEEGDVERAIAATLNQPKFYANNIGITLTHNDARFFFGDVGSLVPNTQPECEPIAIVSVPLSTLKDMRDMLVRVVEAFENNHGPIPQYGGGRAVIDGDFPEIIDEGNDQGH